MDEAQSKPKGPNLALGVKLGDIADRASLLGHVGDEAILLARLGDDFFAIASTCSHYGGAARRGVDRRRYGAVSLAPCLFQLAHW